MMPGAVISSVAVVACADPPATANPANAAAAVTEHSIFISSPLGSLAQRQLDRGHSRVWSIEQTTHGFATRKFSRQYFVASHRRGRCLPCLLWYVRATL